MKKVISSILICLTAVSAFASCGKDEGSSDKKKDKGIIGKWEMKFERKEESEDMYGDYEIPEKMNASGEEGFLTFEKEGVSYMTVVETHSYTYDEESGEIRLDEDEAGDKDTVKVDGDTLTFTDSFGNEQVFERAD